MSVETTLTALTDRLPDYELIRDCIAGQRAVKKQRDKYLPIPDPLDVSAAAQQRYSAYLQRAAFYPATGRTLRGLIGLVYDKDPAVEAPELLAPVLVDAAGDGIALDQLSQMVLRDVASIGRCGLLVDYPRTQGPTTIAQARTGNVRPTITRHKAEDIINWRTTTIGAKKLLSLVVIRETYVKEDDGFAQEVETRFRVLRLEAGIYTVTLWEDGRQGARYIPTDGKGNAFNEIPFTFVGSMNNDPTVDEPPLLDIAELNIQHFLNSADYEESVFLVGQPTPVFAGLTKDWVDTVFREEIDDGHGQTRIINKVRLGSRAAVPLPVGGSAELLQADPNSLAFEAMEHKEKQMIALGAKLIENTGTVQTATEAVLDSVLDNSVLATAARNVSAAITQGLRWAWQFMSGEVVDDEEIIDYELSTDFGGKLLTAADRAEIVGSWQKRAITYSEMRWGLRRAGTAYLTDEEAKAESDAEREESIEFEANAAAALADAGGGAVPPKKE